MRRLLIICILILNSTLVDAQKLFSDNVDVFFGESLRAIASMRTEAANKVAYDFKNAWNNNYTSAQKRQIQKIAKDMQLKGYNLQPYLWWYFSYLSYAVSQAELSQSQLSKVLDINAEVLETLNKEEYANFLLGLNTFMARRILTSTNNIHITTDGGSFSFEVVDSVEPKPIQDDEVNDPVVSYEDTNEDNQEDTSSDAWSSDDDWGSTDDWGSNDDWGNTNDWGNTDADATTGDNPSPVRQKISVLKEDFVQAKISRYKPPLAIGPQIKLLNNSLIIATPYDSVIIKEFDGSFLLGSRVLVGSNAIVDWPQHHYNNNGAKVTMTDFFIAKEQADFWTPYAKLSFPGMISEPVEGLFEFKSQKRKVKIGKYPIFTSNTADVKLDFKGGKITYEGGIKLEGNVLYGESVSREHGKLKILDGKGNSVTFKGESFLFKDSIISSKNTKLILQHGEDSLTHGSVTFKYDRGTKQLTIYRNNSHQTEPFQSTYFQVAIGAEKLYWDLNKQTFDFNIVQAKDLVAATVTSNDYYSDIRFRKMAGGFPFHPIVTTMYYANKYGIESFSDEELRAEFDIDINLVKAAMNMLSLYGFAEYDKITGQVQLTPKIYHFYSSAAGKKDFDNIIIASHETKKPNLTVNLDSGHLKIRGVSKAYVTGGFDVTITPDSSTVTMLKNRDIKYNGQIEAGDFIYTGEDFTFKYEDFMVDLVKIDSISIKVAEDTLSEGGAVKNQLTGTSGSLYLDSPDNKSGKARSSSYPYFITNSESIVYFDGKEILGGAYDKSVFFVIPPFEEDSLALDSAINFDGYFESGGIFPEFDETLEILEDKSFGFIHKIPAEGYNLYGTAAKTYEEIYLSNDGIRGGGKIDFLTATIFSPDFVYYPDSVAAFGSNGYIGAGTLNGASYPEAVLGPFRMKWRPRKDSMYIENLYEPFKFYNATAELNGTANITTNGVYGSGTMFTRGSKAVSEELNFKEFEYSARHASFEVLTDIPTKPAMAGEDISLIFDLTKNVADISPEKQGVAAISFPYAKIKTSITKAVWDLEDSVVTMSKPPDVPVSASFFYSTLDELKGLKINAELADYDFNTKELNIKKIPYIQVADGLIIPENNETTILENSVLQPFKNAEIILDTTHRYHYLYNGNIQIISREEFTGTALYRLVTGADTFAIRFDSFVLSDVSLGGKKTQKMMVSGGEVLAKQNLAIDPGFYYKGEVTMYSKKKALELTGSIKPILEDPLHDHWILFNRDPENVDVSFQFEDAIFEDETPLTGGLYYSISGAIYTSTFAPPKYSSDEPFFTPKGKMFYDSLTRSFVVESPLKTKGETYEGRTFIYNDSSKNVIFEGPVNYINPNRSNVRMTSTVLGYGNVSKREYTADSFIGIDLINTASMMDIMASDLIDIVERLGPPLANDLSVELLSKLANYTNEKATRSYEQASLKGYKPLFNYSENLEASILISNTKMKWSQPESAWYNYTKIGISNILDNDVNAKMDGFMEIKKDASGQDMFNLFVQAAPGSWYYISYTENNLLMHSSNEEFNAEVASKSNIDKAKPGELILVSGDDNETLTYINSFRRRYFGIDEPYDLVVPGETQLEDDENFDTIKKEDADDGFGF